MMWLKYFGGRNNQPVNWLTMLIWVAFKISNAFVNNPYKCLSVFWSIRLTFVSLFKIFPVTALSPLPQNPPHHLMSSWEEWIFYRIIMAVESCQINWEAWVCWSRNKLVWVEQVSSNMYRKFVFRCLYFKFVLLLSVSETFCGLLLLYEFMFWKKRESYCTNKNICDIEPTYYAWNLI